MPYPTDSDLRAAGIDAHVARLTADAEAQICRTLYGRVAWRLAQRIARRRTARS